MGFILTGNYGFGQAHKYGVYSGYNIIGEQSVYGNTLTKSDGLYCRNETHTDPPEFTVRN